METVVDSAAVVEADLVEAAPAKERTMSLTSTHLMKMLLKEQLRLLLIRLLQSPMSRVITIPLNMIIQVIINHKHSKYLKVITTRVNDILMS